MDHISLVFWANWKKIRFFKPPFQCRRHGEAVPPFPPLGLLRILFGASRNDKATGSNGKRNNNAQRWFSFEVFSNVCKIAGHQLLYIIVTQ